jgi:hypothetical protein
MRMRGRAVALVAISLLSDLAVASPVIIESGAVQGTRTNDITVYSSRLSRPVRRTRVGEPAITRNSGMSSTIWTRSAAR